MISRLASLGLVLLLGLTVAYGQIKIDSGSADSAQVTTNTNDISTNTTNIAALAHDWTNPAFDSGDYTGSGSMTWTVEEADVVHDSYMIIDNTYFARFDIENTTVGGTPNLQLQVAIRGNKQAVGRSLVLGLSDDNGTESTGRCAVADDGTNIFATKDFAVSGNWAASTNNTRVSCTIFFEVEDVP